MGTQPPAAAAVPRAPGPRADASAHTPTTSACTAQTDGAHYATAYSSATIAPARYAADPAPQSDTCARSRVRATHSHGTRRTSCANAYAVTDAKQANGSPRPASAHRRTHEPTIRAIRGEAGSTRVSASDRKVKSARVRRLPIPAGRVCACLPRPTAADDRSVARSRRGAPRSSMPCRGAGLNRSHPRQPVWRR